MGIKDLPREERPREKMLMFGHSAMSNGELLAILIGSGQGGKTALGLAEEMLNMGNGGLGFLAEATPSDISAIKGIGPAKACQVTAAIELGKRIATRPKNERYTVDEPEKIAQLFMEKMRYYKKEYFNTVLLNTKGEIIAVENIAIGDLSCTVIHPREVFNKAIKMSAASIIFIHNHPSGNPKPSKEDLAITKRLIEVGEILGIKVLDHIIIGDGEYLSFRDRDYI